MRISTSVPRRIALGIAPALLLILLFAASAQAWHGTLVVDTVNVGGPPTDTFAYTVKSAATGTVLSGGSFSQAGGAQKSFTNVATGGEGGAASWKAFVVAQTDKPGYDTSIACTIDPVWDGTGKDGSVWTPVYTAAGGAHLATVELRWWNSLAYTTRCTVTNTMRPPTTLRVVKQFIGAPAGSNVDLLVDGAVGKAGAVDGESTPAADVAAGEHTFAERATGDGRLVGRAEASCVDEENRLVLSAPGPELPNLLPQSHSWSVTVPEGRQVTCTIVNRATATITITKITDPPSDLVDRPTFDFTSPSLGSFTLGHAEDKVLSVLPGTHTVTELQRPDSTLLSIVCSDQADPSGASSVDLATRTATVSAEAGESVNCTFTNSVEGDVTATSIARTARALAPVAAVRGAALRGTTAKAGCVDDVAIAEVAGRRIKRVRFFVDGKEVRYLHRRADRKYVLRHGVGTLRAGTHKLRAVVRFTRASRLKPVTLRMTFERCA